MADHEQPERTSTYNHVLEVIDDALETARRQLTPAEFNYQLECAQSLARDYLVELDVDPTDPIVLRATVAGAMLALGQQHSNGMPIATGALFITDALTQMETGKPVITEALHEWRTLVEALSAPDEDVEPTLDEGKHGRRAYGWFALGAVIATALLRRQGRRQ
jgi:hypothetical protein